MGAGNGEVEVSAPSQGLVLHEEELSQVSLDLPDAWFTISLDKRRTGKDFLKDIKSNKKENTRVEPRKIGETRVKIETIDREGYYRVAVNIAGREIGYRLAVGAASKDNESLRRFLGSIRISGQPLLPELGSAASTGDVLPIEKLQINQIVFDSLKAPDSSPADAKFAKIPDDPDSPFDATFNRRLFLVRKPKPWYTDAARRGGKQGAIRSKVEFRSDGTIGDVTIDPSLDKGLAQNVAIAISKIKFVPAERNGTPVTTVRTVSYTFAIY